MTAAERSRAWYERNRDKVLARAKARYYENHEERKAYNKKYREERKTRASYDVRREDVKAAMLYAAKNRAKKRGLEFDLTTSDFEVPTHCPVFGIELKVSDGRATDNSPSLDRIDSSRGYVRGNVQVISKLANTMKNNASQEQLIAFAKWVLGDNE